MKLNQATAASFLSVSAATLSSSSSSSVASTSTYDKLKDKIAPLLASRPERYLHRMLQEVSDQCIADMFDAESRPTFNNVTCPEAVTMVENIITFDYNACEASFREACTVDNGTIVDVNWGDIVVDCTFMGQSVKQINKESFICVATSCVSEWESVVGQMPDEFVKEAEIVMSESLADASGDEFVECKIESSTTVESSVAAAGEGPAAGSSSAGEATTGAGAAESLAAGSSSAGEATTGAGAAESLDAGSNSAGEATTGAGAAESLAAGSSSAGEATTGAGAAESLAAGSSSAGEATTGAGAAESLAAGSNNASGATTGAGAAESLAAGSSSAGKATGMVALATTSAATALFIF